MRPDDCITVVGRPGVYRCSEVDEFNARGKSTAYYIIFSRGEGVNDPSQSQCVYILSRRRHFNLNKSANTMAPSFLPCPFRFFCFSPSIWVQPVCIREKRNESKTREARARLLSPVRAKNTPPLRYPSRLPALFSLPDLSPFLFRPVPSSSLFLDLRSTRLPRSWYQSTLSVPRLHQTVASLAINKKKERKKEKITRAARARAHAMRVSRV